MAAVIDADQRAQVALVSRQDAARAQLRSALGDFGADVVAEQDAGSLDVDALRGSGATVVIVSLDSDNDAEFDALQPLLEDPDVSVVFDEASVSSQLSGWDLARWARHLAAKVLGHQDADPPRPEGAEALGGSENLMPVPGAPPTPEQLAGEPLIEEFTIEADELADAVPTDYMPMEEPSNVSLDGDEDHLDLDLGDVESAMSASEARAEVSPTAVPDATPEDPEFELPEADFSALEIEVSEVEVEVAGIANDSDVGDVTTTLADIDFDNDEPVNFGSFDAEGGSDLDLDADEDVARLAAQLDEQSDAGDDGLSVEDLTFVDDRPAADDGISEAVETVEAVEAVASFELADDDSGFDAPAMEETAAKDDGEAATRSFDFGSLSLEPMEGDAEEGAAGAEAAASPFASPAPVEVPRPKPEPAAAPVEERPSTGRAVFSLEPMEDEASGEETPEPVVAPVAAAPTPSAVAPAPNADGITRVIVLGASIGGPDALRTFLGGIPKGFPALFVLAQHLESGFFGRLAEQLQKASALPVRVIDPTQKAANGQVLVVSAEQRVRVAKDGSISLEPHDEAPKYQPSIDNVLRDVADIFGGSATAIIFSGMAGDAIEGSVYLTSKGGEVWAQDSESCVVSSMVDGARARGVVEFTGSPRELASRCVEKYGA